jgi:hypothetical protein
MESCLRQKHIRTLLRHHLNSTLPAKLHGFEAHRPLTASTVHPNGLDATFPRNPRPGRRSRSATSSTARRSPEAECSAPAQSTSSHQFRHPGIHRDHVITRRQSSSHNVTLKSLRSPDTPTIGNPGLREEVLNHFERYTVIGYCFVLGTVLASSGARVSDQKHERLTAAD